MKKICVINVIIVLVLSCIASGVYTYQMLTEKLPFSSCDEIILKDPIRIYSSTTPAYPNTVLYDLYQNMKYEGAEIECVNEQHGVQKRYEVILQSIQENNTFDQNNIIHILFSKGSSLIEYFEIMVFYYICFVLLIVNILIIIDEWLYSKKICNAMMQSFSMILHMVFLAFIPHLLFKISCEISINQSITLGYLSLLFLIVIIHHFYTNRNDLNRNTLHIRQYD